MSCGGRVYKGDTITISVPFNVDDYSNLKITYTTTGNSKIVLTEEDVVVEDGFITHTFQGHDLDLLPDGVIYYTIECDVLGVPNVDSTNTNLYLKTPAGYSGRTAEDIYQEGYEAGLEDCSGSTDCSSAVTEAYQSGYTEGYNQGQADCPECDCSSAITEAYQSGITEGIAQQKSLLGSVTFTHNSTFTNNSGWSSVTVNVPKDAVLGACVDTPTLSDLTDTIYRRLFDPEHSIIDGWGEVNLDMKYIISQSKAAQKALMSAATFTQNGVYTRENGWSAVTVDIPQCDCSSAITEAYQDGYNEGHSSGYTEGYADGQAECPECSGSTDCSSAITEAYQSGYTEGWDSGFMSGAGVELVDYVHSTNMGNNVEEYLVTNIIPTKYTKAKFAGQYKQYTTLGVLVGFNDSGDSQDWRLFVFENGAPITYGTLETMFDVGLTRTEIGAGTYSVNDDLWFEWGYESGSTIMRSPQISRTFTMVDREPAQGDIKINMGIMWVSSVQIWDNGTLVFDGKAAKRNNDYGLWDSVSKTFLTDANLNLVGETK